MGKAGFLTRYRTQTKSRIRGLIGGFQLAVIKPQRFTDAVLQIELTIIGTGQRLLCQALRLRGIKLAGKVEEATGICCHRRYIGVYVGRY